MRSVVARRSSRIAFGGVLIAGSVALVASMFGGRYDELSILWRTWVGAVVAAGLARVMAAGALERDTLAIPGLVVPAVGLAFLGPISVHAVVGLALFRPAEMVRPFHEWALMSLVYTAPAHLAFAVLSARRAVALLRGRPAMTVGKLWWWVTGISCLPFVIVVLPPVIVGLTGVVFLPLLSGMDKLVERERAALALVGSLPAAVARQG